MKTVLTVRLLDVAFRADRGYDYYLSEEAEGESLYGRIVTVPFGKGNRTAYALVVAERKEEGDDPRIKTVLSTLSKEFCLTAETVRLCLFLHDYLLCSVGEAVRAAMPAKALGLLKEEYLAENALMPKGRNGEILAYVRANPGVSAEKLAEVFGASARSRLSKMVREGLLTKRCRLTEEAHAKTVRVYAVAADKDTAARLLAMDSLPDGEGVRGKRVFTSESQRMAYRFLLAEGPTVEADVMLRLDISASPLQTLLRRGLLTVEEREIDRNPYALLAQKRDTRQVRLSAAQEEAYASLSALYDKHEPACALLHGVTGSGKTLVMMKLLDKVLGEGRQAILLVPEIALTPQTVGIFCSRYGERVSVLHSRLSVGERFDAYRKIYNGKADLVIGTRSAVFAPLSRLGLIILDEEHEHTYKSDASPRYHARDVAAFRSKEHNALTVLASATPLVEDYYKAKTGKYTLVPLKERYGGATLPTVEVVDMREELRAGNTSSVSRLLADRLTEAKEKGEQAILFLNRRGYYHTVSCRGCGEALECPHCSVALSYHSGYKGTYLLCHACGYKAQMPSLCPACGGKHLSFVGAGTQKAEAELALSFKTIRMDADTTVSKASYERLLDRFRGKEADILLGTQMVTKGHDFPAVSVAGVLLADSTLHMSDFRASERTFSLLTQVIGRAGRAKTAGKAVIQTFCPTHPVIRLAAMQDYEGFYAEEIRLRQALLYPPFCDFAVVLLRGKEESRLLADAKEAADALAALLQKEAADLPAMLYGPLEMQNYKVAEQYRVKLLVKCRLTTRMRALFGRFLTVFSASHENTAVHVDFNPTET